ncbi:MAG: hypothetical protein ABJ388_11645 [Alphaproteobacteria bacterium]
MSDRNWVAILALWETIDCPPVFAGVGLDPPLDRTALVGEILSDIPDTGEIRRATEELKKLTITQGAYLLLKAINVLGGAQLQYREGMPAWSVTNAYQAAFFASRAVLRFLGLGVIQTGDRGSVLYDVWPGPIKGKKKSSDRRYIRGSESQFIKVPFKLEHGNNWDLFLTAIGKSENLIKEEFLEVLLSLDSKSFSRVRNKNIYFDDFWSHHDLSGGYSPLELDKNLNNIIPVNLNSGDEYFSFHISFYLIHISVCMLSNLCEKIPNLKDFFESLEYILKHPEGRWIEPKVTGIMIGNQSPPY